MESQKTRKLKIMKRFSKGALKISFTSSSLYFHQNLGVGKCMVAKRKNNNIVEKLY